MQPPRAPRPPRPRFGLHLITWLALVTLIYAIAFCQFVPQERELSFVDISTEFGWPVAFVQEQGRSPFGGLRIPFGNVPVEYQFIDIGTPQPGQFWLNRWSHPWPWEYQCVTVDKTSLCLDIISWIAMTALTTVALESHLRKRGSKLQVSLCKMLVMTGAVAATFAILPTTGIKNWLDPYWIQDQLQKFSHPTTTMLISLNPEFGWKGWCLWTPECTLVALILCIGLTCTFYAAGLIGIWLMRRGILALKETNRQLAANGAHAPQN